MFEDYEDVLSTTEACELLKIGKNALYQLLRSGDLKGFRCSNNWKVPKLALEEYILRSSNINPKGEFIYGYR